MVGLLSMKHRAALVPPAAPRPPTFLSPCKRFPGPVVDLSLSHSGSMQSESSRCGAQVVSCREGFYPLLGWGYFPTLSGCTPRRVPFSTIYFAMIFSASVGATYGRIGRQVVIGLADRVEVADV